MPTPLRALLDHYRSSARSQREKGTYFERLTKIWLEHAPTQAGRYARVLTYTDFGRERGESGTDTGIDLVAELADDPGRWCAIQCKFYAEGYRLQRSDIDGFLAASARAPFARRMFVDTTGVNWTDHAETTFRDQAIETQRVGLTELEESGIDWSAFAADGTVRLTGHVPTRSKRLIASPTSSRRPTAASSSWRAVPARLLPGLRSRKRWRGEGVGCCSWCQAWL